MNWRQGAGVCLLGLGGVTCGGGSSATSVTAPSGTRDPGSAALASALVFTHSPIPLEALEFVVPIGNLNPPDHTLPTDHAYFYFRLFHPGAPPQEVVAPAGGVIREVRRERDDVLRVQATSTQTYYLAHITADTSLAPGAVLTAGQRIGVTSNLAYGIDLGLSNDRVTIGFISPSRYSGDTLHAENPFQYFEPGLRAGLYARERGTGVQPEGRIDFDRAGTLAGNWFLEGLSGPQSTLFESGAKQLAFVRDVDDPSSVRISIGGTLSLVGAFATDGDAPDPAGVSLASGRVAYRLRVGVGTATPRGWLLVEMLSAERLRAETFDSAAAPDIFTPAAQVYVR